MNDAPSRRTVSSLMARPLHSPCKHLEARDTAEVVGVHGHQCGAVQPRPGGDHPFEQLPPRVAGAGEHEFDIVAEGHVLRETDRFTVAALKVRLRAMVKGGAPERICVLMRSSRPDRKASARHDGPSGTTGATRRIDSRPDSSEAGSERDHKTVGPTHLRGACTQCERPRRPLLVVSHGNDRQLIRRAAAHYAVRDPSNQKSANGGRKRTTEIGIRAQEVKRRVRRVKKLLTPSPSTGRSRPA